MRSLVYGLAATLLWKTGLAIKDSNGNYILEPITDRSAPIVRDTESTTNFLQPMLPSEMGLKRRADLAPVGLQNDASMFWGQNGDGSNVMVNLTLSTGEQEMIVSMDHFKDELASVVCDTDLTLTFQNEATYQAAIDDWEWVNFEQSRTFIMIVNYGGCSSESGREPWVVHGAKYDHANFRVEFTAVQTEWSGLTNEFEIEWGSYTPPSTSTPINRRISGSKSFDINLAHSIPDKLFEKATTSGLDLAIGCDSCATTGKITITGKAAGKIGIPPTLTELSVTAIPSNIGADFNPSFTISGELGAGWTKDWSIFSVSPPGTAIAGIFEIGPELTLSAGFALSGVQGSATVKTGISAKIPDSATAKVDLVGTDSNVDGWKPAVTTKPISFEAEVQGTLAVYTTVGVDVGLTVFSKKFGVGLEMQVPKVTMTLGAEFNSAGGVCPNHPEMFGVKFDASVGVDLSIQGWTGDKSKPSFQKDLYNAPDLYKFPEVCLPFAAGPKAPFSFSKSSSVPTSTRIAPTTATAGKSTVSTTATAGKPTVSTTATAGKSTVSTTATAGKSTVSTTVGNPPIGTGPIGTGISGTKTAVAANPPASGRPGSPIYSNSTVSATGYLPKPSGGLYNPGYNPTGINPSSNTKTGSNPPGQSTGASNPPSTHTSSLTTITTSHTSLTSATGNGKPSGTTTSTSSTSTCTSSDGAPSSTIHHTTSLLPTTTSPVNGYAYATKTARDSEKAYKPKGRLARHLV